MLLTSDQLYLANLGYNYGLDRKGTENLVIVKLKSSVILLCIVEFIIEFLRQFYFSI